MADITPLSLSYTEVSVERPRCFLAKHKAV